jgi:hypothetical protein
MSAIEPMFTVPLFRFQVPNWKVRKQRVLESLPEPKDEYLKGGTFTDYHMNIAAKKSPPYKPVVVDCLAECLAKFRETYPDDVKITSMWFERSFRSHYHGAHNHGAIGFSAVFLVEFDPNEHTPTRFIAPHMDFYSGSFLDFRPPQPKEGELFMFPSIILHDTDPNASDKPRTIISFNVAGMR